MADAQKTNLRARETALKATRSELSVQIKSLCQQLLSKAEYRALTDLVELDSATIDAISRDLLRAHAEYLGVNSQLASVEDALYG
jgi:hypothetical protein